jgi:hypothetical protein
MMLCGDDNIIRVEYQTRLDVRVLGVCVAGMSLGSWAGLIYGRLSPSY